MPPQQPIELDLDQIKRHVSTATAFLGSKWLEDELGIPELAKTGGAPTAKQHPVALWYRDYYGWLAGGEAQEQAPPPPKVLRLVVLGAAASVADRLVNVDRIKSRLRDPREFASAEFELDIASLYARSGWEVEFVEEGRGRTPDLIVKNSRVRGLSVECKRRDRVSKRDRRIEDVWHVISKDVTEFMREKRLSFRVEISWKSDPEYGDVSSIIDSIQAARAEFRGGRAVPSPRTMYYSSTDRLRIRCTLLTSGSQEFEISGMGFDWPSKFDFDTFVNAWEFQMVKESDSMRVRCPMLLALKTEEPPDRVKGLLQSLKSAVKQIPKDGPGVVWVRVPDGAWHHRQREPFERAENLLKARLKGEINRRVNTVVVLTRELRQLSASGHEGVEYATRTLRVDNENPRTLVDPLF